MCSVMHNKKIKLVHQHLKFGVCYPILDQYMSRWGFERSGIGLESSKNDLPRWNTKKGYFNLSIFKNLALDEKYGCT